MTQAATECNCIHEALGHAGLDCSVDDNNNSQQASGDWSDRRGTRKENSAKLGGFSLGGASSRIESRY